MSLLSRITIGFVVLLCASGLIAIEDTATQQVTMNITEICLVRVTGNPQNLVISLALSGGIDQSKSSDDSSFVQYTSTVAEGRVRSLTIKWGESESPPSGCVLKLKAIPTSGPNQGFSTGEITMSAYPQTIISNIGSCVTGIGSGQGARLLYSLVVANTSLLQSGENKTVIITLTLTDIS